MDSPIIAEDNHAGNNNHETAAVSPNPLKCPPTSQHQLSLEMNYPPVPLNQLSPERLNQPRMAQSPSLHSYLGENDRPRTRDSMTSDVQSKVAFLNTLAGYASVQSSPTRTGRGVGRPGLSGRANSATDGINNNTALQQAVMGYEEAQASLATLTAELERAKEEMAARKKRERILSQRVEDLLGELQAEKEKRARDQESYSKEIKRCRKEAYRAELAVVESRQDLQEVRAELKRCQAEVQHEKAEKEKSRQESFERAYALAGTVGEMEQLKDLLKVVERERDAALFEAKANAVDKPAVLGNPGATESEVVQRDEMRSWSVAQETEIEDLGILEGGRRFRPFAPTFPTFESIMFELDLYDKKISGQALTPEEEIQYLKQELKSARRQHAEDADLIHFMHIQCQFKACPCRLAEANGERFIHDHEYEARMQQKRSSKKRKISKEPSSTSPTLPGPTKEETEQLATHEDAYGQDTPKAKPEERDFVKLPPAPTPEFLSRATEEPLLLEEASEIPLPIPQPEELDANDDTPELTAQLEEITQVLVEPGTTSKPFSFSASTTSNPAHRATAPPVRHMDRSSVNSERDLFDLSPPKQPPPRRPSTAMGILTVDSPIRLVPDSPRSVRASRRRTNRSTTPVYDGDGDQNLTRSTTTTTTTTIALKDGSSRPGLHRRAQSRPNLTSQSPLASSVMSHIDDRAEFTKETSASPAPNTLFPVTPLHKHSRSMHTLTHHHLPQSQSRPESQTRNWSPPQTIATTTTTTRVPLRGFEDADETFSPDRDHPQHSSRYRHGQEHAHTEVLNVDMDRNTMTRNSQVHETDLTNVMRPLQTSSTSILGNIPGTPISREAALAQIRARRDRARSINLKKSTDGSGNMVKGAANSPTKPKPVNGGLALGGLFARDKENAYGKREISQASAPGRFAY
ncbi:hypothetical protein A1O3_07099 [Capronia epimyces CBS 606.96]|uniref:Uncharacterized protein n=1 Tax=Capronia epimyces CBS 606.96 TaxID=1182542 RepID=W9XU02_9EURO|nr:uncharacterized protein A1O3_07099 [Capronia epimyces CBS 606.96]EXJ80815.1 hypothetical protein A1O3_07099 [Capronia epimyces CBS 606.96]